MCFNATAPTILLMLWTLSGEPYTLLNKIRKLGKGHAAVIVFQNVFAAFAFLSHAVGAILAHADAVAVAFGGNLHSAADAFHFEVGGVQIQFFTDFAPGENNASDFKFRHTLARRTR